MTPHEEAVLRKVTLWIQYADEDFRVANALMNLTPPSFRNAAYHAQQSAEKYLKGLLLFRGIEYPYTHNILALLELTDAPILEDSEQADAETLTSYAVFVRCPEQEEKVVAEEARLAIAVSVKYRRQFCGGLVNMVFNTRTKFDDIS